MVVTAGLWEEPEGYQAGEYVQLADGKWYHKTIARELAMARAAEEMQKVEINTLNDEMNALNPKHIRAMKDGKSPLEYLVKSVWDEDARVHKHGADKYGKNNWRADHILVSTYEAAILRHYKAYFEDGEDIDPDSGEHHLTHIRACCAVMRDAEMHGTLIDDRGRTESKSQ